LGRCSTIFGTTKNSPSFIVTVLSLNWNPEDKELFKSTAGLIRDTLFYSYIDLVNEYRLVQNTQTEYTGMSDFLEEHNIVFLLSEVEQNLNYLNDKRKIEMESNFKLIEDSAARIQKTIIAFTVTIFLVLLVFSSWIFLFIRRSLSKLNSDLGLLTQGIIPAQIDIVSKDEMGSVFDQMNRLFAYLKNLTIVSQKINIKEFNNAFKP